MSQTYIFSIAGDFPYQKMSSTKLKNEIDASSIVYGLDHISTADDSCSIVFKHILSAGDLTTLSGIVALHDGILVDEDVPRAVDGRPIVRSDSRPQGYYTYFTMAGDTASGIGDGKEMFFDFSDDTDLVASGTAGYCEGYKTKRMELSFIDPVYVKEGTVYFFNTPKRSHLGFKIVCPQGGYYLDNDGNPNYAYEDTEIVNYVNKHFFSGSCPMGDELNTEGCNESPIPPGYKLRFDVCVPTTVSGYESCYGYGEVEMYRPRTVVIA